MFPSILTRQTPPGLLGKYPGAHVAYSLRRINPSYTGKCLRVKRTSDNTEKDISFEVVDFAQNQAINVGELEAFCAGTNGEVVTWYDQSGNGDNFSGVSGYCRIVTSGSYLGHIGLNAGNGCRFTSTAQYEFAAETQNYQAFITAEVLSGGASVLGSTNAGGTYYGYAEDAETDLSYANFTLTGSSGIYVRGYRVNNTPLTGTLNANLIFDEMTSEFHVLTAITTFGGGTNRNIQTGTIVFGGVTAEAFRLKEYIIYQSSGVTPVQPSVGYTNATEIAADMIAWGT